MKTDQFLQALLDLKENNPAIFDNFYIEIVDPELNVYTVDEIKLTKFNNTINITVS